MKWQAVVFDLDDTLYPEQEYVLSGFNAVSIWIEQHFNIPATQGFVELRQLFERGVRMNTFDVWLNNHQLKSDALIKKLIDVYREHSPQISTFPGTEITLSKLRQASKLGIISDGYLAVQQKKLNALNIESLFDSIIFSDKWGRESWKPSDKPYREALLQLQTIPELTVYVGDNPLKDFYGARLCGWHTVWLRQIGGEYSHMLPPSSDFAPNDIVHNFSELMDYLQ